VYPLGVPALYAFILFNRHGGQLQLLRSLELRQVALEADRSAAEELKAVRQKNSMSLLDAVQLAAKGGQANVSGAKDLWEARRRSSERRSSAHSSGDMDDDMRLDQIADEITKLHAEEEKLRAQLPDYVQKLILGYELRAFYFEVVESVRKLAIVCLPVFFRPSGSVSQLIFGLMVCFITFGTHVAFHPYDHSEDNFLSQLCQVQIFFSLVSAIALKYDEGTLADASGMDTLLSIITMLPIFVTIYLETPLRRKVNEFIDKHSPFRHEKESTSDTQLRPHPASSAASLSVAESPMEVQVATPMDIKEVTPSNIQLTCDDGAGACMSSNPPSVPAIRLEALAMPTEPTTGAPSALSVEYDDTNRRETEEAINVRIVDQVVSAVSEPRPDDKVRRNSEPEPGIVTSRIQLLQSRSGLETESEHSPRGLGSPSASWKV